ncbi:FecR family protein [Halalkalibaculum sp. DA3122]|uniref:FecR family protein n=1 Tax=unclassified Halalkalibaculum TaxID=2964617 RepID=UPI003754CC37
MKQYEEKIWILITRDLSNEITSQEQELLEEWLSSDPENRAFYNRVKKAWEDEPEVSLNNSHLFDYERGLSRLRSKLSKKESNYKNAHNILNKSSSFSTWKVAASVLLIVVSLSVFITVQYWEEPTVTYTTGGMEQRIISLSDGTKVHLNKNSKIEFPEVFKGDYRRVELKGEAFFQVEKNNDKPFKVHLEQGIVEVLGTSFNIKEMKKSGKTLVAVKEGRVSFESEIAEQNDAVLLSADQVGILSAMDKTIRVEDSSVDNYLSWRSGELKFERMPLDQVCLQLERIYEIQCELADPELNSLTLTVHTEKLEMDDVLSTMAMSLNIEYQQKENKVIWYRN